MDYQRRLIEGQAMQYPKGNEKKSTVFHMLGTSAMLLNNMTNYLHILCTVESRLLTLCQTRLTRNCGQVEIFLKSRFKLSAFQLNLLLLSQIPMCRNFG